MFYDLEIVQMRDAEPMASGGAIMKNVPKSILLT